MNAKSCLILVLVMLAIRALATDVWYGDAAATSQNGRFVIIGKSPENIKKHPEPFQQNFTFELRDTKAKKTLWSFKTGEDDEPGGSLYVSNEGLVVRLGVWETLWLIRPSGERVKLGNVFEHLPKSEVEAFCDQTTAGTFWAQFSWREFVTVDEKDYFYIRTYWGRYIVIDLDKGQITKSKALAQKLETKLVKKAGEILSLERKELWSHCESCEGNHPSRVVARSLMVLELHKVPKRDRIVEEFRSVKDNHMHNVVEHIERLRKP